MNCLLVLALVGELSGGGEVPSVDFPSSGGSEASSVEQKGPVWPRAPIAPAKAAPKPEATAKPAASPSVKAVPKSPVEKSLDRVAEIRGKVDLPAAKAAEPAMAAPVATPPKPAEVPLSAGASLPERMPEPIQPPQFDPASVGPPSTPEQLTAEPADPALSDPANPQNFSSKREELGKPRAMVPEVPAVPAATAEAAATPAGSSGWYKLLAGALFLASLGLLGYRHKQKAADPFAMDDYPAGSWMPPRKTARRSLEPQRSYNRATATMAGEESFPNELISRTVSRKARRSVDDDMPFHEDIERRVRKLAQDSEEPELEEYEDPLPARGAARRGDTYRSITARAEMGQEPGEIARALELPLSAVRAIMKVSKNKRGRQAEL